MPPMSQSVGEREPPGRSALPILRVAPGSFRSLERGGGVAGALRPASGPTSLIERTRATSQYGGADAGSSPVRRSDRGHLRRQPAAGRLSKARLASLDRAQRTLSGDRPRAAAGLGLFALSPVPSGQLFVAAGLMTVPRWRSCSAACAQIVSTAVATEDPQTGVRLFPDDRGALHS